MMELEVTQVHLFLCFTTILTMGCFPQRLSPFSFCLCPLTAYVQTRFSNKSYLRNRKFAWKENDFIVRDHSSNVDHCERETVRRCKGMNVLVFSERVPMKSLFRMVSK